MSNGKQNENGECLINGASSSSVVVAPLKWKARNVSAVRDFPPGCGPIVRPINGGTVELQNGDTEKVLNEEVKDDQVKTVSAERAMKKFPVRRVSAVRDFPPYCGLNAAEPSEEERVRINGRRNVKVVESNGSGKEEVLKKTQSDETSHESKMITVGDECEHEHDVTLVERSNKVVHNIGQACQELVVYTREKFPNKQCSDDDDSDDEKLQDDDITREPVSMPENRSLALIQNDIKNLNNRKTEHEKRVKKRPLNDTKSPGVTEDMITCVLGLQAASRSAPKIVKKDVTIKPKGTPKKRKPEDIEKAVAYSGTLEMVVREEQEQLDGNSHGAHEVDVTLPPFGPKSSNDARNKVRETLRYFQAVCRKLLQGEEAKTNEITSAAAAPKRRVDLQAKAIIDEKGRAPVLGKKTYGPVPGVEVGDEFQYRVELALVGIHRPFQGGIDYIKQGKNLFAVSVVASGGYDNEIDKPNTLMYSGAGGVLKDKSLENQKLEKGNLALKNNIDLKYPVRVVRGYKVKLAESSDAKSKMATTYIYDGLYTVDSYKQEPGPKGNMVFKFELNRIPGQPELAIREVKSKKFRIREGVCVKDITNGKEVFPICAVNTINDEKPPEFTYITKIMYPDWYKPIPPKGCDCVGRCTNKRCSCAFKNGGEIPYNRNGAIVEAKPLVYECGPSCRCPPSCYNRVTQHGMKIPLEIFKTESRGWGVRSLRSISSGSFICEYVGELLEDTEAEKRTGNDEYLFDIGQNYTDCYGNPDTKPGGEIESKGESGFTIDAAYYGNVGRFINHSCSPNLYAQNVLYDEEDKRMPHIMLFAAENIPPLKELTYHYNYAVDTVHDSDGNIKIKSCYCGSSECTGRLY